MSKIRGGLPCSWRDRVIFRAWEGREGAEDTGSVAASFEECDSTGHLRPFTFLKSEMHRRMASSYLCCEMKGGDEGAQHLRAEKVAA